VADDLSIVVVAFNMDRELPRTLRSLAPAHQLGVDADEYELIVIDNGSNRPLDDGMLSSFPGRLRWARLEPAPPSPARAANVGLGMAESEFVGLWIDGARMASPGLLAHARLAARLAERPVVATLGWHLGSVPHMEAVQKGYDQEAEDRLLNGCGWEADGYRLFDISTLAGSSRRGWFGPMGETNALFMPRTMWHELDGLDERFDLPGGGLVNHDLYRRACELDRAQLVVLLGEGTFHQFHGGAATGAHFTRAELFAQYEAIRGRPYQPPSNDPLYVGRVHPSTLPHVHESTRWALRRSRGRTHPHTGL
jgi:hypothetical protein